MGREKLEKKKEKKTRRVNPKPETGKNKRNDAEVTQDKADMCISRKTLTTVSEAAGYAYFLNKKNS